MQCSYCGNEHPDEAEFCPNTGQSLKPLKISSKTCPHCGENVVPDAQFCQICGEAIEGVVGTKQEKFQERLFFKRNFRKLALVAIIIIIVISIIIFRERGQPATLPSNRKTATLTNTMLSSPLKKSPTFTMTATIIPTTATATATSTPTELERKTCPGAPPIRVEIGDTAHVTSNCGNHILMRSNPLVATNAEQFLYAGDELKIIDGPQCSNDVSFFLVEAPKYNKTGWVAEAEPDSKIYCIELVP
jgi:hypothetical protein